MRKRSNQFLPSSAVARLVPRVRTELRGRQLDRDLARGFDPEARPELALRAKQLTSEETRAGLARALEAAVHLAHASPPSLGTPVGVQRYAVRDNAKLLLQLAERLREQGPADARGVAMVRALTSDGSSPLYWARAPESLGNVVRSALGALDPGIQPDQSSPRPSRQAG
jgi:hypothetical protein